MYTKLLGLDLLLGVDVIMKLRGAQLSGPGEMSFAAKSVPHIASIVINEPDFSKTFDWHKHVDCNVKVGGWLHACATDK